MNAQMLQNTLTDVKDEIERKEDELAKIKHDVAYLQYLKGKLKPTGRKPKKDSFSEEVRETLYEKFDGHCAYCGQKISYEDMQLDYINPSKKGGRNAIENYFPACCKCHFYKSTYSIKTLQTLLSRLPKMLTDSRNFRLALAYGLVEITNMPVKFYFEQKERQCKENPSAKAEG